MSLFFCFHLILFHLFFSSPFPFIGFSSPSPYFHSLHPSSSFSSSTECLLVTEQPKLNMFTRPRREILKSYRKKTFPGVTADRGRHAVLSYPRCFTVALCTTSRLCPGGHLHGTVNGHPLLNLLLTVKSMYLITSRCKSQCEVWGNREDWAQSNELQQEAVRQGCGEPPRGGWTTCRHRFPALIPMSD